jgi:tetratricopeptide (TPR) repeat protein
MKKIFFIVGLAVVFCHYLQAQSLEGKYLMVKDSDGKVPKKDASITLQFSASGSFAFTAIMPGTTINDKGTYKINGNTITISFNEMEQGKNMGNYSLEEGTLMLPFKMLDTEKGSSIWQKEGTISKNDKIPASSASTVAANVLNEMISTPKTWQTDIDDKVLAMMKKENISAALSYYAFGVTLKLKNKINEAAYCFAKASSLQKDNGLYLNNLAMLLLDLNRNGEAIAILNEVTKKFPTMAPAFGNLGIGYTNIKDYPKALVAINKALELQPLCGTFIYTKGCIEDSKGNATAAQEAFEKASENGHAKAGRRAAKNGSSKNDQTTKNSPPKNNNPKSNNNSLSKSEKLKIWEGNYQAEYMKARTGENNTEANTQFGQGVATTIINLQTLACVKSFSMNVSSGGSITGQAEIMYVYQGMANGPAASLALTPPGVPVGFGAVLKNGYQIRNWNFSGEVDELGNVEIKGLPTEKLDLYNVGKWQKITPWSPIKPDSKGPAMQGPFHFKLTEGEKDKHFAQIDDYVVLDDKLIKKVHYQMLLVKTNETITPNCQMLAAAPNANQCPASESIKTKIALSPGGQMNISSETSKTYTKGTDGKVNVSTDNAVNTNIEASYGMVSGAAEIHGDGSYELSIGLGVNTESVLPNSPVSLSNNLYLIYDSKCGWGVKAAASAKAKLGTMPSASGAIEGTIFFNKSL